MEDHKYVQNYNFDRILEGHEKVTVDCFGPSALSTKLINLFASAQRPIDC